MAYHKDDRFFHINGPEAEVGQRRFRVGFGKTKCRYLGDIGYFHSHLVDHARVEDLGFKVKAAAFLTGMGDGKELGYLVLAVIKDRLKVTERLWRVDANTSRLVTRVRMRTDSSARSRLTMAAMDPAAFIMTRRMLLGLKQRAEALKTARAGETRAAA